LLDTAPRCQRPGSSAGRAPLASTHDFGEGERGLRIETLRANDISNWLNRRGCRMAVKASNNAQANAIMWFSFLFPILAAARKWRHAKIRLKKAKLLSQCRKNLPTKRTARA
jgi:hypothetical protein